MSKELEDLLAMGGTKKKAESNWSSVKIPTNKDSDNADDDYDPNEGLYSDEPPVAPQKKPATKREELEEDIEDFLDEEDEPADVTEEDEPEADVDEEEAVEDYDEPTAPAKKTTTEADKKLAPVPKRLKKLMEKLERKDAYIAQEEMARARREAELIQAVLELQNQNAGNAGVAATSALKEAETAVSAAKRKWASAKANGMEEDELDAMEELSDAKARLSEAKRLQASAPKATEMSNVDPRQILGQYKAKRWFNEHQNFLSNPTVQQVIRNIDSQLVNEGYTNDDDTFYSELNKRANEVLKAKKMTSIQFGKSDDDTDDSNEEDAPVATKKPTAPVKKAVNPMGGNTAPAGKRAKNSLRLDDTDKAIARKFGLDADTMLRQKALGRRPQSQNYVPVFVPSKRKPNGRGK